MQHQQNKDNDPSAKCLKSYRSDLSAPGLCIPACLILTKLEFPVDAVNKKLKLISPGVVTAAKPTGAADFLILCHANDRAQRDGDELQRELDDFLGDVPSADCETQPEARPELQQSTSMGL